MQGEVYLIQKKYELAALHVKIAAKLATGFNQSKAQRALVEAFLGNHQQVTNTQHEYALHCNTHTNYKDTC